MGMKRIGLILIGLLCCMFSYAQTKNFDQVYEACLLVQSSMDDGKASNMEIARAAELLNSAKWSYLRLYLSEGEKETKFGKENIVFTPEYLQLFSKDKKLANRKAKQYAEEKAAKKRGDENPVKLCTKCIAGKSKVTYGMRKLGNTLNVAAVAEVNGLINLYVTLVDKKGTELGPYKISSKEFEGMPNRKLPQITMKKGMYDVYITIENKYDEPRSVAIILE